MAISFSNKIHSTGFPASLKNAAFTTGHDFSSCVCCVNKLFYFLCLHNQCVNCLFAVKSLVPILLVFIPYLVSKMNNPTKMFD